MPRFLRYTTPLSFRVSPDTSYALRLLAKALGKPRLVVAREALLRGLPLIQQEAFPPQPSGPADDCDAADRDLVLIRLGDTDGPIS